MTLISWRWVILGAAIAPSIFYLLVIFSARQFFRIQHAVAHDFLPPISVLKPVHGLETEAYENFASFCRQDYPEYEILFGVSSEQDPASVEIRKLYAQFPQLPIRLLVLPEKSGSSDKVNKLCGLAGAARHNLLVLSDADIRVGRDYLRSVAGPFRDAPGVGAVTSMFTGMPLPGLWPELEAIAISTDFMPAVLMARQLEGVRFALGATVAVRGECLDEIGGFEALVNEAADDYELGSRIAARGHRVELVNASVKTWCCLQGLREFFTQRLRWAIMARQARYLGYLGLVFTQGLPWTVAAAIVAPTRPVAERFVAAYLLLRMAVVWQMAIRGLHDNLLKRRWWLVPLWDGFAFMIWAVSLIWSRVRWRGRHYRVSRGRLIPMATPPTES